MSNTIQITDIRLYNLLKSKHEDKEAEEFVLLLKEKVQEIFESHKEVLATKADLKNIEIKLSQLETRLAQIGSKLHLWAFVFWVTQLGAIFAFIKLFIR